MHQLHGIFIAKGPEINRNFKIDGVRIIDLGPTALHILDLPIPSDMDGKPLVNIFHPDSKYARKKIEYVAPQMVSHRTEKLRIRRAVEKLTLRV
jgi:predicted AlkP superfamily phosphohydrolase/phosphomutase